jgi:hypothetical protein
LLERVEEIGHEVDPNDLAGMEEVHNDSFWRTTIV